MIRSPENKPSIRISSGEIETAIAFVPRFGVVFAHARIVTSGEEQVIVELGKTQGDAFEKLLQRGGIFTPARKPEREAPVLSIFGKR